MDTLETQKKGLKLEVYLRWKINYNMLTDCFMNKTVADRAIVSIKFIFCH